MPPSNKRRNETQAKAIAVSMVLVIFNMTCDGGFRGAKGAMAPCPALLVAEKGPAPGKKLKLNHRKTFEFSNKGPAYDFGPGSSSP